MPKTRLPPLQLHCVAPPPSPPHLQTKANQTCGVLPRGAFRRLPAGMCVGGAEGLSPKRHLLSKVEAVAGGGTLDRRHSESPEML